MVVLSNTYPGAVQVRVGGQIHDLAPGQVTAPIAVMPAASGNDVIEVWITANPGCGEGDAFGYFFAGKGYRLRVLDGGGSCLGVIAPTFQVLPGLS